MSRHAGLYRVTFRDWYIVLFETKLLLGELLHCTVVLGDTRDHVLVSYSSFVLVMT